MNVRVRQTSQKILVLAAVASVMGHLLMLSLTGLILPGAGPVASDTLTVNLREAPKRQEHEPPGRQAAQSDEMDADQSSREETVDLGDSASRHIPYLIKIKNKIDILWAAPAQIREQHQPGMTVVRFTLNRNGSMHHSKIEKSSGVAALDSSVLSLVRAAAPFQPFPADMALTRLHIIATFHYRKDE
jgi:TonB family protein